MRKVIYYLKHYIVVQGGGGGTTRKDKPRSWYPIYVSKDLSKVSLEKVSDYEEVLPITNTGREDDLDHKTRNIHETI